MTHRAKCTGGLKKRRQSLLIMPLGPTKCPMHHKRVQSEGEDKCRMSVNDLHYCRQHNDPFHLLTLHAVICLPFDVKNPLRCSLWSWMSHVMRIQVFRFLSFHTGLSSGSARIRIWAEPSPSCTCEHPRPQLRLIVPLWVYPVLEHLP